MKSNYQTALAVIALVLASNSFAQTGGFFKKKPAPVSEVVAPAPAAAPTPPAAPVVAAPPPPVLAPVPAPVVTKPAALPLPVNAAVTEPDDAKPAPRPLVKSKPAPKARITKAIPTTASTPTESALASQASINHLKGVVDIFRAPLEVLRAAK